MKKIRSIKALERSIGEPHLAREAIDAILIRLILPKVSLVALGREIKVSHQAFDKLALDEKRWHKFNARSKRARLRENYDLKERALRLWQQSLLRTYKIEVPSGLLSQYLKQRRIQIDIPKLLRKMEQNFEFASAINDQSLKSNEGPNRINGFRAKRHKDQKAA
jgi:hypothetical protein